MLKIWGLSAVSSVFLAVACGEDTDGYGATDTQATGGRWHVTGGRAPQAAGTGGDVGKVADSGGASSEPGANAGAGGDVDEYCGNGRVEAGEACDDGNMSNRDLCLIGCTKASCGDGYVQPGEACDPGDPRQPPCESDCTLSPVCGNGVVDEDAGEECDDGNAVTNDDCTNSCKLPTCGDGIVHNRGTGDEFCDDGEENGEFPATCSATCSHPDGCGNGEAAPGQECDDGDLNGDTASCLLYCAWNACGDGYAYLVETSGTNNPNPLHECDDENDDDSDACTKDCAWNVCGDGIVFTKGYDERYDAKEDGNELADNPNPTEACDDGNDEPGDGCYECQLED